MGLRAWGLEVDAGAAAVLWNEINVNGLERRLDPAKRFLISTVLSGLEKRYGIAVDAGGIGDTPARQVSRLGHEANVYSSRAGAPAQTSAPADLDEGEGG
jgi:hypothetical protein